MSTTEIEVKLIKSLIGSKSYQRNSIKGLGLSKLGQVVFVKDNNTEKLYLRIGGSTMELIGHQMQDYICQQFSLFLQIITFKHCIHQYAIEITPAK